MADEKQVEAGQDKGQDKRGRAKERMGVVVATNNQKTVMVMIGRRVKNTEYGKYQIRSRKLAVHDLIGCAVGDHVRIRETRPISKTKRWKVVEKLDKTVPLPARID